MAYTGYRVPLGVDDVILQAAFSNLGSVVITGYTWASSDTSKATVTAIGNGAQATLHPVAAGTTTITLTGRVYSGSPLTHTMDVEVEALPVAAVSILALPATGQGYPNDPSGQIPGHGSVPQ